MKLWIDPQSDLAGLTRHLETEGESVTGSFDVENTVLQSAVELPISVLDRSEQVESGKDVSHFASRFWNGSEFLAQTIIGMPLVGVMNHDLGHKTITGCACRYVDNSKLAVYFDSDSLHTFLRETGFHGFVSFKFSGPLLVGLQTQIPYYGLYGVLEGVDSSIKLSQFLLDGGTLHESWTVSLLLTRFPFPRDLCFERVSISGLSSELERHFWLWPVDGNGRRVFTTTGTIIGVATGWHRSRLSEAARLAERTASLVEVEGKQYRTDTYETLKVRWARVREVLGLDARVLV